MKIIIIIIFALFFVQNVHGAAGFLEAILRILHAIGRLLSHLGRNRLISRQSSFSSGASFRTALTRINNVRGVGAARGAGTGARASSQTGRILLSGGFGAGGGIIGKELVEEMIDAFGNGNSDINSNSTRKPSDEHIEAISNSFYFILSAPFL